jgi:hypothetical protein
VQRAATGGKATHPTRLPGCVQTCSSRAPTCHPSTADHGPAQQTVWEVENLPARRPTPLPVALGMVDLACPVLEQAKAISPPGHMPGFDPAPRDRKPQSAVEDKPSTVLRKRLIEQC